MILKPVIYKAMATARAPATPPTSFIAPVGRAPAGAAPLLGVGVGESLDSDFDGALALAPDAVGVAEGVAEAEAEAGDDAPDPLTRDTT